ncbi:uncharacterized protein RJT20DRAFT_27577 [Scheffersomyces xylosifermentans]|uniref:uncharacterized protein n=1 Tax=Scheffersomyces xylosifermentans TaxID=1304137 RepID=UPI00315D5C8B
MSELLSVSTLIVDTNVSQQTDLVTATFTNLQKGTVVSKDHLADATSLALVVQSDGLSDAIGSFSASSDLNTLTLSVNPSIKSGTNNESFGSSIIHDRDQRKLKLTFLVSSLLLSTFFITL